MIINPYIYATAAACDTYWDDVVVLAKMEGSNLGTTFSDSSSIGHTITSVSGAYTSTTEKMFGSSSLRTDGTSYITISDSASLDFGSGDFTIEMFCYTSGWPTLGVVYSKRANSGIYGPVLIRAGLSGALDALFSTDGSSYGLTITCGTVLPLDVWFHLAVTRSGTSFKVFVDGDEVGSGTLSGALTDNSDTVKIGRDSDGYGVNFYVDEVRITKGVARYTAAFTAPDEEFPTVAC